MKSNLIFNDLILLADATHAEGTQRLAAWRHSQASSGLPITQASPAIRSVMNIFSSQLQSQLMPAIKA